MGILGGSLGYWVLRNLADGSTLDQGAPEPRPGASALEPSFDPSVLSAIDGKVVLDFGCGDGGQSVELALRGAKRVIGLDVQPVRLERARALAKKLGVQDRCVFAETTDEKVDVILSKDAFEHFEDPAQVLRDMERMLKADGIVLAAFGPTWWHPYGGHGLSVFPWSHLLFTERAQMRWRSQYRDDGAQRFEEVAGGLNRLTIHKFRRLVRESPLEVDWIHTVPIRGLTLLKTKLIREVGSAIVRCQLRKRNFDALPELPQASARSARRVQ